MLSDVVVKFKIEAGQAADCVKWQIELNHVKLEIRTECPLLGRHVVITGTNRGDVNGREGVATSFDHGQSRYVVDFVG